MGSLDYGADPERIASIAEQIHRVADRGVEVAIVVGGGNIYRGLRGAAEVRVFEQQAADKPENIRPKIVEGRVKKWLEEVVLLKQEHVNRDKHTGQTIEDLRAATAAKTGENVVIRRFARFQVGAE